MAYLSTDPLAGQPYDPAAGNRGSGQPINQPMGGVPGAVNQFAQQGGALATLGNPAMGGFSGPPPPAQLSPNSPVKTDNSFDASDPVTQAIQAGLQAGLTGDTLIQFVKQRFPQANVTWDAQRGNVDYGTGGPNGIQFDTNAQGVWGAHPYDDAGMPSGGASGAGFGSLWNTLPSADEIQNMPGLQYAMDEANRGLQAGAAARGTLLNARTQEGIGKSLVGTVLSQGYLPLAQLKLGYNQANTGNLYNLANLGLSGVQNGNQ